MSLLNTLQKNGRFPPVKLLVNPLDQNRDELIIARFLDYTFDSSVMIPVDTFNFSFVTPGDLRPINQIIEEGDICVLTAGANDTVIATGLVDQVDIEVDNEFGEKITIAGRDLASQLEDQDSVSIDSQIIWATNTTVLNAARKMRENTRIKNVRAQGTPTGTYLLATEPGESKLSTLQRFTEAINCIFWMDPDGTLVVGKPNFVQKPLGSIVCSRSRRFSNVFSIKASRASTSIPNIVVPILSGQESAINFIGKERAIYNAARGPSLLRSRGHRVLKTVVTSYPEGASPQELDSVNRLKTASSNLLQAMGKREIARQNFKELIVQAVVPGHYNENGDPFKVDTVYQVEFERANVNEAMYLYQVQFMMSVGGGQKTSLSFCRLGTIVADAPAPGVGTL